MRIIVSAALKQAQRTARLPDSIKNKISAELEPNYKESMI